MSSRAKRKLSSLLSPVQSSSKKVEESPKAKEDPPAGWRKFLLDEDPISITDITKVATPTSTTATASGNNTVWTPASGKKLRIKLIDVWNSGTADITVFLRFGAAGTARFKKLLAPKTGFIVNLIATNWEGAVDEALIINLSAAGTVEVTAFGDEI